ncbi:hypothetical protein F7725_006375 [Dissostichus mawsoni]|uniref:Uncharacterized protein n=1 Tax=Dissostichus mawsoni TaxID=36200 RepID=A0A7J5XUP7_DISMA|nr:hypothetical protein F7725_006375 [Dissostichus mawsoni]
MGVVRAFWAVGLVGFRRWKDTEEWESGGRPEAGGRGAGLSGAEQAGGLRSRRVPKETLRTERRSEPEHPEHTEEATLKRP